MHYIAKMIGIELFQCILQLDHAPRLLGAEQVQHQPRYEQLYELVTGKSYKGSTCVFGEPLLGYSVKQQGLSTMVSHVVCGQGGPTRFLHLVQRFNSGVGEVSAPHSNRLAWTPGILCQLQVPFI